MTASPNIEALAAFLPKVARVDFSAGRMKGGGKFRTRDPSQDTHKKILATMLPYPDFSETTSDFIQMAYDCGWIIGIDWPQWCQTEEAQELVNRPGQIESASVEQLQKLLTWRVRAERFSTGSLLADFESGLILRILRRATQILQSEKNLSDTDAITSLNWKITKMTNFSPAVCDKLGHYVYRLIDPRNGETFYVGKGRDNRLFNHVKARLKPSDQEPGDDLKLDRIGAIHDAGLLVIHVIHRHELTEEVAFEVEAAVMDAFPGLTNKQGGHDSDARGPMAAEQIVDKYELPELPSCEDLKLVLISVGDLDHVAGQTLLDRVRFAWRINADRAAEADYVLAARRGVVIGVYEALEWLPATEQNFPGMRYSNASRWGFVGKEAPKEIQDRLVGERGKRITEKEMLHIRYPIRYWQV